MSNRDLRSEAAGQKVVRMTRSLEEFQIYFHSSGEEGLFADRKAEAQFERILQHLSEEQLVQAFDSLRSFYPEADSGTGSEDYRAYWLSALDDVSALIANTHGELLEAKPKLSAADSDRVNVLAERIRSLQTDLKNNPLADSELNAYVVQTLDDLIQALKRRDVDRVKDCHSRLVLAEREYSYGQSSGPSDSRLTNMARSAFVGLSLLANVVTVGGPVYGLIAEREAAPISDLIGELDGTAEIEAGRRAPALAAGDSVD